MHRVPYRRVTPSRQGHGPSQRRMHRGQGSLRGLGGPGGPGGAENMYPNSPAVISPLDNLIIQLAISGVLMMAVLVISLVDFPPAASLGDDLRQVLTGATTPRQLQGQIVDALAPLLEDVEMGTEVDVQTTEPPNPISRIPLMGWD